MFYVTRVKIDVSPVTFRLTNAIKINILPYIIICIALHLLIIAAIRVIQQHVQVLGIAWRG